MVKDNVETNHAEFDAAFGADSGSETTTTTGSDEHQSQDIGGDGKSEKQVVESQDTGVDADDATVEDIRPEGHVLDVDLPDDDSQAPTKEDIEKALKIAEDNKAWATKVAQENADLRRRLDALENKQQSDQPQKSDSEDRQRPSDQTGEAPEEIRQFLEDFPEAKGAIEWLASNLAAKQIKEVLGDTDMPGIGRSIAEQRWLNSVMYGVYDDQGNYMEGHPDLMKITAPGNKDYWDWYNAKKYGQCDPMTAIKRISEYKAEKLATAGRQQATDQAAKAREMESAMSGRLSSSRSSAIGGKPKPKGFEEAFDED